MTKEFQNDESQADAEYPDSGLSRSRGRKRGAPARRGRGRAWLSVIAAVLCIAGGGVVLCALAWQMFFAPGDPVPFHLIKFETSRGGGLTREWFVRALEDRARGGPGRTRDIHAVKRYLATFPQIQRVKSVDLHLLDDGFDVVVEERRPVLRYLERDAAGGWTRWLVAGDGVLFPGEGHNMTAEAELPLLVDGAPGPSASAGGAREIPGAREAAALVLEARMRKPDFFREWEAVSLSHFHGGDASAPDARLRVLLRAGGGERRAIGEIWFTADPREFKTEVALWFAPEFRRKVAGMLALLPRDAPWLYAARLDFFNRTNPGAPFRQPRLLPVTRGKTEVAVRH